MAISQRYINRALALIPQVGPRTEQAHMPRIQQLHAAGFSGKQAAEVIIAEHLAYKRKEDYDELYVAYRDIVPKS